MPTVKCFLFCNSFSNKYRKIFCKKIVFADFILDEFYGVPKYATLSQYNSVSLQLTEIPKFELHKREAE